MRLQDLTAWHLRIPLKKTIRHASHVRTENDTIVVRCRLDDGTAGWGEGLPREYVTGESIGGAMRQLRETDVLSQLGARMSGPADVVAALDNLRFADEGTDARGCLGNSVRCAVELAVLDACCQTLGCPLADVTTWMPGFSGIAGDGTRVRYSGVITAASRLRQWRQCAAMRVFGFRQIKVKVGSPDVDDERLLATVRRVLGQRREIRVDANESWAPTEAAEWMSRLSRFGIASFEQPVAASDVGCLADVRAATGARVMLDESLCSISDAEQAIAHGWCDAFNIRLSKCGGFLRSLRLVLMARQAGLACQLGCQVGETRILSAAGRHFASSVRGLTALEGSYDRFLVREPLSKQDLTFGYGGWARVLPGPGLGISVDQAAVDRCAVDRLTWGISE